MNLIDLSGVDLNLLVTLNVLLDVRSTTEAARRLGRTQSAVSHALGRLREVFGDPLLVRDGRSMVPTSRALELEGPLRELLEGAFGLVFGGASFDAATSTRCFSVSVSDYIQLTWLPALVSYLETHAPGVSLHIVPPRRPEQDAALLASGELDFSVMVNALPESLMASKLFVDRFVTLIDKAHPFEGQQMGLEDFVRYAHVLTAPIGDRGSVLDQTLREAGLERRIAVTVAHFLMAPRLLPGSSFLLTQPEQIAHIFAREYGLRTVSLDFPTPRIDVSLAWHARAHRDPGHRWFRAVISTVCGDAICDFQSP